MRRWYHGVVFIPASYVLNRNVYTTTYKLINDFQAGKKKKKMFCKDHLLSSSRRTSMTKSEGQKEGKRITYDGNIMRKTIFQERIAQCPTNGLRIRYS